MQSLLRRGPWPFAMLGSVCVILLVAVIDMNALAFLVAKAVSDRAVERHVSELVPLRQGAVGLGSLAPDRGAYIEISSKFTTGSAPGYPNLFQTGPGNAGIRLEVGGGTAALIVHDYNAPDRLRIAVITRTLDPGEHDLEIEALNGQYVRGRIDSDSFAISGPIFDVSNVLFGGAFNGERLWNGGLTNAKIRVGHVSSATYKAVRALRPIVLVLASIILILGSIALGLPALVLEAIRQRISDGNLLGGPWKQPGIIAPDRSASRTMARLGSGSLGLLLCLGATALYHGLYFNRYAPVTEGWFLAFSHLIDYGLIPYRDFTLMLPPLYTFATWVLHHVIGDNLFQLRLIGFAVVILLFLVLQDILTVFFARWLACVASSVAVLYYQSGVAFIGYDFTQFLTLYLVVGLWALQKYWLKGRVSTGAACYLFASGVAFSLAVLTKHSNAGVALAIMGVAFVLAVFRVDSFRSAVRQLVTFSAGVALPLIVTVSILAYFDALGPLFKNTGSDALAAKGGLNVILFGWLQAFYDQGYFGKSVKFGIALAGLCAAIVFITVGATVVWSAWVSHTRPVLIRRQVSNLFGGDGVRRLTADVSLPVKAMIAAGLVVFCLLLLALRAVPTSNLYGLTVVGRPLLPFVPAASVSIYFIGILISGGLLFIWGRQSAGPWFLLFSFGTALIAGNGTSSVSLSEISLFIGVGILVAGLLTLGSPSYAGQIPTLLLTAAFCLPLAQDKFLVPYYWWFMKAAPVNKTVCLPAPPLLDGLCFDPGELTKIEAIVSQIKTHSVESESIYVYPHMPMFALLSDRRPYGDAAVSWYDFMGDRDASRIAENLMSRPPPVVVLARLPDIVLDEHERYFRGGKRSGQRDILEAIDKLSATGRLKRVLDVEKLNDVDVTVFVRNDR